ncbi:hypothetical protein [Novosphingobium sp. BL-52-GroH]|uniref:hypothetical protein n=1 Tax=Novosphingobium sp. BL-52-GroH TaxID=3349877 RepID=UPI00384DEF8F
MLIISTHGELANVVNTHADATLRHLLSAQAERLADYDLSEIATLVVVEPHDTLDDVDNALGRPLASLLPAELVERQARWLQCVFIISDDGFGLVLFIPADADPAVLAFVEGEL